MTDLHLPVLAPEVASALNPRDGGFYVDGTFGRGGYARALLDAAATRVHGIDRDPEAIAAAAALAPRYGERLTVSQGRYGDMDAILQAMGVSSVDGIALDLGVSSPQIDTAERGFSFRLDGPLDMRMGTEGPTAADIVNTRPEAELADILYTYGEERMSRRIARAIVAARRDAPIERTGQLASLVRSVVPGSKDGIDPATRTFQGLRIYVNDELGELERGLASAERLLKAGGRLAVVSFHSLEDRITKDFLRVRSGNAPHGSRHRPVIDAVPLPSFRLISRKPLTPGPAEIATNPRARSAKLRVAERTAAPGWPSRHEGGLAA